MDKEQKKTVIRLGVSAVLCAVAWALPLGGWARAAVFAVPYLIIGCDVLIEAFEHIIHGHVFDEEFLMVLATLGAFAIKDYPEAVFVMLFFRVGELFEEIAQGKSRKSIAALMDIRPDYAVVMRNGEEKSVPPDEVKAGEIIVVKPGERIPLDGEIVDGTTTVNTAALTGESLPVDKAVGDGVVSGSVNVSSVIRVKTSGVFGESTVAKILKLVEASSEKKAKVEGFITRFAKWYTPAVVIGAVLLALLPPLLFSGEWGVWLNRALTFLVVSCPCALVVSVPLTFFSGIGGASLSGILIKGANYIDMLSEIDTVVFDKTGTLTKGSFAVEAIHPNNISQARLLDIAAAAESYSAHPVGESIVKAHTGHIDKSRIDEVSEIAGMGIKATVDGSVYYVGNGKLMESVGAASHECHLTGTVIHIACGSEYLGHIVINDEIKPDSAWAIDSLKKLGITKTVMLTGDSEQVARAVGERVGVDEIYAKLLPAQKVEAVEGLINGGRRVAFVGDGINDAPVLMRADVGIAMGALGSDAAIESADIVLMDDKPSKIAKAIGISRRTMRIARQNIVLALGVKAAVLLLGAVGAVGMWAAVFGDVGVLIIAVLNAVRAMKNDKS